MDARGVPSNEHVRHNFSGPDTCKAKSDTHRKILQNLIKFKYKTAKLSGLENRKTNDLYTRLYEDCQVYFNQMMSSHRLYQLEKNGKKVKSNALILESQKQLIEEFTGKSLLAHLRSLFRIYMGSGHVVDALRILKTIGQHFRTHLHVMFGIFRFYLEVGNLRKAESFLLRVISPLKKSPRLLTIYALLLFEMKKYKEALIIYEVRR